MQFMKDLKKKNLNTDPLNASVFILLFSLFTLSESDFDRI